MARETRTQKTLRITDSLFDTPNSTLKEIGLDAIYAEQFVDAGLIRVAGTRKHTNEDGSPKRGRPSHEYRLTDKARKQVKRRRQS